jgi:membrane protein implicated in regulation of membrane protease activity
MTWANIYLLCFGVGAMWALVSLLLGGLHLHIPKIGMHATHGGHGFGGHGGHGMSGHGAAHGHTGAHGASGHGAAGLWVELINPSCVAVFLAWFGAAGYLFSRHSSLGIGVVLAIAIVAGNAGAIAIASFLRYLNSKEKPMDPADYDMVGVLGRVTSTIRKDGVGEVIYLRDGARRPLPARSEEGIDIRRDQEVIVTRYEKGIAYVRTWEAMTQ